ncbi:MAG: ATP-binding protein [Sodalinema sp.]|uniref:AAA family ATPase n=1 Tax=Sodalinema sp. TaxID=3080550 RepID=UPI00396F595F
MVSIDQIIQRTVNPFDSTTFRPGNFWHDDNSQQATINSIHQEIVSGVSQLLNQVEGDRRSRTIVLSGDSGSGKSFLLGRLKRTLNPQAFFAYIGPWPESDYIWRHTLRHTIDSLTCVPEGETESQLLLWLNSLSAFRDEGLLKKVIGERNLFIHNFKSTYPSGIYNANEFFSILYHLTNPELYPLACDWLKGDDLDHESLKLLNVRSSIETEHQAQNILGNFGRIATATQPIVLCFDNLDNVDRSNRGYIDLQALFNVNSIIHNQKLKNFLVIISIITDTWRENSPHVQPADLARVDQELHLRPVDIPAAIALWESRIFPLHQQADSTPNSSLYPLCEADLHRKFPGNQALPRSVLMLGRQEFQKAKLKLQNKTTVTQEVDQLAAFHLTWENELAKSRKTVQEIRQFSAPELMKMLREALEALNVTGVEPKLLKSPTYSRYSLSFYWSLTLGRIGVIWIEEPNLNSFCRVMKSCQDALRKNTCQYLYLIRAENLGVPKNQGYRRYQALFVDSIHKHIIPQIESLQILATYHSLVNAAEAGDLLVGDRPVNRQQLKELVIDSEVLQSCRLLQNLGVFERNLGSLLPQQTSDGVQSEESLMRERLKEYMFALVKTQQLVGRNVLMESTRSQFPEINREGIDGAIGVLCDEGAIVILNPESDAAEQLITVNS